MYANHSTVPSQETSQFSPDNLNLHYNYMRCRIINDGAASLADHELLATLLSPIVPGNEAEALASRLIDRFGSFSRAISAHTAKLLSVPGADENVAAAFLTARETAERLGRAEMTLLKPLNNWARLMAYLHTAMAHKAIEQFRVLYLDARNRLIGDELQGSGTVNHAPVYPREVIRRALEMDATALILVHNHPSGDPSPSHDDVEMTHAVKVAAEAIGIALHDHIIIAQEGWRSFRKLNLL